MGTMRTLISLAAVTLTVMVTVMVMEGVEGARVVDVKELLEARLDKEGGTSHRARREARRMTPRDLVNAGPQTQLEVEEVGRTVQGSKLLKMKEKYRGQEVFDSQMTIEMDPSGQEIRDATGVFLEGIEEDTDGIADVYPTEALYNVLRKFGDTRDQARDVVMEPKIFTNSSNHAFPGYLVQYTVEEEGVPRRPTALVDGRDGSVLLSWNSMTTFCPADHGTGVGGNEKAGDMQYNGVDYSCLAVTRVGDVCELTNDNVTLVNMGGVRWYNVTQPMTYDCVNATDAINGAYSPALDAFYIGTAAFKMFDEWYGMPALRNNMKLTIRVHFGTDYPNAFWNGVNATFGDGRGIFHPFVSIDLVGHEIGHALAEQYPGLIWFNEPGALNEGFADITGEVLEYYVRGGPDWLTGYDITKTPDAVRYFEEPEKNYISISTMQQFIPYMEPHQTGGILARAFYRLVNHYNQTIRQTYEVFLHANRMYWNHMTSIKGGICELMKSVYDLGQPGDIYRQAFEETGVEVCDTSHHVVGLHNNQTVTNVRVSSEVRPVYIFGVPADWTDSIFVDASSPQGPVHITVTNQTWLQAYNASDVDVLGQGYDHVMFSLGDNPLYYVTVTLSSDSDEPWDDVSVTAGYTCMEEGETAHGYFEYMRKENCEGRSY